VFATSSRRSVLDELDLLRKFNTQISVPNVNNLKELGTILYQKNALAEPDLRNMMSDLEIELQGDNIGVGVRDILEALEIAKRAEDVPSRLRSELLNIIGMARGDVTLGM
jgi:vesicle-fusing ATPase